MIGFSHPREQSLATVAQHRSAQWDTPPSPCTRRATGANPIEAKSRPVPSRKIALAQPGRHQDRLARRTPTRNRACFERSHPEIPPQSSMGLPSSPPRMVHISPRLVKRNQRIAVMPANPGQPAAMRQYTNWVIIAGQGPPLRKAAIIPSLFRIFATASHPSGTSLLSSNYRQIIESPLLTGLSRPIDPRLRDILPHAAKAGYDAFHYNI